MTGIYERLGVRTIINAAGDLTRLGGTLMEADVLAAMQEAAGAFVVIQELQAAAGAVIARLTGAEAGYVTAGAGAGITLGIGACLATVNATDPNAVIACLLELPDTVSLRRRKVVLQAKHRTNYLRLFAMSGAPLQLVEDEDQLASALASGEVAAVGFVHQAAELGVPFERVVELAGSHGLPVLVDAAAALPPVENFSRYVTAGADLVAFSGGKALHGPQPTGILAGRTDLIRVVSMLQQGTDLRPRPFAGHGIGRPMKVGKEEIVGAIVALERYLERDHTAEYRHWVKDMHLIAESLQGLPGVRAEFVARMPNRRPLPAVLVHVDESAQECSARTVLDKLMDGSPRIALGDEQVDQGILMVYSANLRQGEAAIIADRMRALLAPSETGPLDLRARVTKQEPASSEQ
jgi:L-seryl-tRNA(Ser) seleniumtransferase